MQPTWRHRINGISFGLIALAGTWLALGFLPGDPGWMIAALGGAALYLIVAVLLFRGIEWGAPVGVGLAGFSTGLWIQSSFALTWHGLDGVATTSLTTCLEGLSLSVAALGLLWLVPRSMSLRHATSVAFAGAALVPGIVFALAPAQSVAVAIAMGVGCAALVAGTVAVGRGRTWGLLVELVGAIVIAIGVVYAPWLGEVTAVHPSLPNCGGFLVNVLGMVTAGLAAMSTLMYAGPVLRFLLRR